MNAVEHLAREHRFIIAAAGALRRELEGRHGSSDGLSPVVTEAVAFFKDFVDAHHHVSEERHVFSVMIIWGTHTDVFLVEKLLGDHVQMRRALRDIAGDLDLIEGGEPVPLSGFRGKLLAFARRIREHSEYEDARLLPAIGETLPPSAMDGLQAALEEQDSAVRSVCGPHEAYPALAVAAQECTRQQRGISRRALPDAARP